MKIKSFRTLVTFVASLSLLANSLLMPFTVFAQEETPSPSPEPTAEATTAPDATVSPTPTDTQTVAPSPTDTAIASPEASTETATPVPTDETTPAPAVESTSTQAPESNPTTVAPPTATPSETPSIAPEEHGNISATILHDTKASSLSDFDLAQAASDGSATILTDKADYAPTDAVVITGNGFIPDKTYTIEITSQDPPAVDFTDQVKADDKGNIVYSYQLDGNFRPNYTVNVNDGDRLIASTTFTDTTGAIWTTDVSCGGVNINLYSNKNDVYLNGGPQGGGGGLDDGSYFVKVTNPSGSTLLGITGSAAVTVSGGVFASCYNLYTLTSFTDTPDPGGEYKVWVSKDNTFPGGSTKTDNFKVVTELGSIELKKIWLGTGGQTTLNIGTTIGGSEIFSQLTGTLGSGPLTTGTQSVETGTYYISEVGGLTNYSSSLSCTKNGSSYTPGVHYSITINDGDSVVCTFTNSLNPYCGDGIKNQESEQCDDGNINDNDACNNQCQNNPVTIKAYKVVCDSEKDLPNWGGTDGSGINATTAQNYVDSHPACHLESGWDFQWGFNDKSGVAGVDKLIGNHIGPADGTPSTCPPGGSNCGSNTNTGTGYNNWKNFDTSSAGITPAQVTIGNLEGAPGIWVRENLKSGYVPFTYPPEEGTADNVSGEIYCHNDVYKYDNYDLVDAPQYGQTYYCVAFNAPNTGTITVNKNVDTDGDGVVDDTGVTDWTWDIANGEENISTGQSRTLGAGKYTISENQKSHFGVDNLTCGRTDYGAVESQEITINPGDNLVCTFTNSYVPYCGDGVKQKNEQCDGTDGITQGQNFCSKSCNLVPIYDGQHSCPAGTVKSQNPVWSGTISSTDPDGENLNLVAGKKYLLEASGTFLPTSAPGYLSDAAYTLVNGIETGQYGIHGTPPDLGAHALLSDFGSGTIGIVDWGSYNPDHLYAKLYEANSSDWTRFVIGDRYGDWFDTQFQNQSGMNDNSGNLSLNVYECQQAGSITINKDSTPNDAQDFNFTRSFGSSFNLDDDSNATLSNTIKFDNLVAGDYSVTEGEYSNWKLTDISCTGAETTRDDRTINIHLASGGNAVCTFKNTKYGTIVSYKYNDLNNSGHFDTGEPRLDGWRINLYDSGWNLLKSMLTGDDTTEAGNVEQGHFTFKYLLPGTYYVCEEARDGWLQTEPSSGNPHNGTYCRKVTLNGNMVFGIPFGNKQNPVTIKASKVVCDSESDLPNWGNHGATIDANTAQNYVNSHEGCSLAEAWDFQYGPAGAGSFGPFQSNTNSLGSPWTTFGVGQDAVINDLSNFGGRIETREVFLDNSYLPFSNDDNNNVSAEFYCSGDVYHYDNWEWINNPQYGQTYYCVAFNTLNIGSITVTKETDIESKDTFDFVLSQPTHEIGTKTLGDGESDTFGNLLPGVYDLSEQDNKDWELTRANCTGEEEFDGTITVSPGENVECVFTNKYLVPSITITKSSDKSSVGQSDTVTYTLVVTNTGNTAINNVEVTDVLPGGFSYVPNSTKINGLDATDPDISGSGAILTWNIGSLPDSGANPLNMATIEYRATTSSDLSVGTYTNTATCEGVYGRKEQKIKCDPDEVTVSRGVSQSYGGNLTPQVLGAATELPATGSDTAILVFAVLAGAAGLALRLGGGKKRKYAKH